MGEKNIHGVSEVPSLIHPQADQRERLPGVGWISALQNTNAEL